MMKSLCSTSFILCYKKNLPGIWKIFNCREEVPIFYQNQQSLEIIKKPIYKILDEEKKISKEYQCQEFNFCFDKRTNELAIVPELLDEIEDPNFLTYNCTFSDLIDLLENEIETSENNQQDNFEHYQPSKCNGSEKEKARWLADQINSLL